MHQLRFKPIILSMHDFEGSSIFFNFLQRLFEVSVYDIMSLFILMISKFSQFCTIATLEKNGTSSKLLCFNSQLHHTPQIKRIPPKDSISMYRISSYLSSIQINTCLDYKPGGFQGPTGNKCWVSNTSPGYYSNYTY